MKDSGGEGYGALGELLELLEYESERKRKLAVVACRFPRTCRIPWGYLYLFTDQEHPRWEG
jgi:hypothetical protein